MPKFTADVVLDAALDKIATSTRLTVCDGQPANFAGIAAVAIASAAVTTGDFPKSDGASGRKITPEPQTDLPVTADGLGNHVAYDDGTTLLHVQEVPSPRQFVDGDTVTTLTLGDITFADVTP